MKLEDFVGDVLKQVKAGVDRAKKEGVKYDYPDRINFEVHLLNDSVVDPGCRPRIDFQIEAE